MERWSGKVAVVTGASVGIGAAIVKALVEHGIKVIGCGRNLKKLEEMGKSLKPKSPGSFKAVKCDVSKEAEVLQLFNTVRREYRTLHILVNNAGLMHAAPLLSGTVEQFRSMCEINIIGLTVCAREAVKLMKEAGVDDGHVFNMASIAAHHVVPSPSTHFYSATKFAVRALTQGLRAELRATKSHIRVTEISPGVVATEFYQSGFDAKISQQLLASRPNLKSSDIADIVIHALSAPAYCGIHDVIVLPVEQDY